MDSASTSAYQITTYAPNGTVVTSERRLFFTARSAEGRARALASRLDLAPLDRIIVERMAASGHVAETRTFRVDYSPTTPFPVGRIHRAEPTPHSTED